MAESSHNFSSWLSQIPIRPTWRKISIIGASSIFIMWFLLIFTPSTSFKSPSPSPIIPKPKTLQSKRPPPRPFNDSKVALLIEDRPIAHLAPLLLHMISVVPPDWRFLFLGSPASISFVNRSLPVQLQVLNGKLDLREIPGNLSVKGREPLSQTMTNVWFWRWLGGRERWRWEDTALEDGRTQVEWVLVWQTDSILCANSRASLNDWLQYDWVGAPWHIKDPYGGNGGLSLRRVSRIIQVLQYQRRRPYHWEMEDLWLIQRIGLLPGARMANGTTESKFSVEQVWSEEPMGYHMGWSGQRLPSTVWDDPKHRERIWRWCPEIKLILGMVLERECGGWDNGGEGLVEMEEYYGLEEGDYRKRELEGERVWQGIKSW